MDVQYFANERRTLADLKKLGFSPSVFYDIGASTGAWSEYMSSVYPDASYHLFEPLADHAAAYAKDLRPRLRIRPNMKLHAVALGEATGTAEMFLFRDAYSSSLLDTGCEPKISKRIDVPLFRLDDYTAEQGVAPPDVIKIDSQGAERAILQGGPTALKSAQLLFLETWVRRSYGPQTPLLWELIEILNAFQFSLVDLGEPGRDEHGRLTQIDAVFYSDALLRDLEIARNRSTRERQRDLSDKLLMSIGRPRDIPSAEFAAAPAYKLEGSDVIVTHAEVNNRHGVGALLGRLFAGQPNLICVRSVDYHEGKNTVGGKTLKIAHSGTSRDAIFSAVLSAFGPESAGRILCVPYFRDDVRTAIAAKAIFDSPMCTFLMDDQNVCVREIPDALMRELLEKSGLRLAISPELRVAYETKYRVPFWFMPPVVPATLIPEQLVQPPPPTDGVPGGIMIGNVWGEQWLHRLRLTVRKSGLDLTWYSNGGFESLACSRDDLLEDRIVALDPPSDDDLVRIMRNRSFAVVPSGTLDSDDDRGFLARLSLPSRIVFLMATAHLPIIVLGSPETAAARFVEQFGIGLSARYERQSFMDAIRRISDRETNLAMRKCAHEVAPRFSDAGAADWIWASLQKGAPIDRRFEDLMPNSPPDLTGIFARRAG